MRELRRDRRGGRKREMTVEFRIVRRLIGIGIVVVRIRRRAERR